MLLKLTWSDKISRWWRDSKSIDYQRWSKIIHLIIVDDPCDIGAHLRAKAETKMYSYFKSKSGRQIVKDPCFISNSNFYY